MTAVNQPRLVSPPEAPPTPPAAAEPVPPTVAGLALLEAVGELRREAERRGIEVRRPLRGKGS